MHACGIIGNYFLAIGGKDDSNGILTSVEMLPLDTMNAWVDGPELQDPLHQASVVQNEDSLLVIGGSQSVNDAFSSQILRLHRDNMEEWTVLEQNLATPRAKHASLLLSGDLFNCQ